MFPVNNIVKHKEWEAALGLLKLNRYKRYDTRYGRQIRKTRLQTNVLNAVFDITKFPSTSTIVDLALLINIHPKSIQKWFQNTRQTSKKKGRMEDEEEASLRNEGKNEEFSIVDISIPTLVLLIENAKKQFP
ncbi:Homeobox protein HD-11 [Nosema granulosis]|uniref:Homeobox protein HD-11 n=1 Tax=Nosema granulosis TaxID=83296 RepID=A0A9P6KYI5_9MICR|nr:Homeobox protein HD-11 [Nosema granulosis]